MGKKRWHKPAIRSAVLTLRLTEEEMLRFKVAALTLGKKRAKIVRERVADLIGGTFPPAQVGDMGDTVASGAGVQFTATADMHDKCSG